jgi:MFS family permease
MKFQSNSPDTENKNISSQTYILITAFMALMVIVGFALYGLPFFYDFWEKDFGWTRKFITSGNAFSKILVAPLFGFIAGWLIDRYGPKKMMLAGILMAGGALIGLGFMNSVWMFYFFYFFNAMGYVFGGPLPNQVLISKWFDKNRGKAMGIAYLGIGTGGVLVPKISVFLIEKFGWHIALSGIGVLMIMIGLPLALFIREASSKIGITEKREEMVPVGNVLRNPNFYLLAFGSLCSIAAVGGANNHLKLYLRDLNFTQADAANVVSLVFLSSMVARVLVGVLADIFPRKYVMIFIYLVVASAIPFLLMPEFTGRIYIFAVIFGLGLGGDYMIIPLMAGDLFGVKALGRAMGIILVVDGIAEATSPMLVSTFYQNAGKDYTGGFIMLICIALAGAVIVSFLPKYSAKYETEKNPS